MWSIGLCVVAFITIFICHWVHKWRNPRCNGVLPPGSMGFPLIGETLHLLIPSHSLDIHPFLKKRIQRYGPIFRTSLAGRSVVVSADAEFNHNIFLQEGRMVEIWYLDSFAKLLKQEGESKTTELGSAHRYIRNIILNHFGPECLREKLLPQIQEMANKTLHTWSTHPSVDLKHSVATVAFNFTAKNMFGYDNENTSAKICEKLGDLIKSLMTFPFNIPGTQFHKCMKVQKMVSNMIKDKLKEKHSSRGTGTSTGTGQVDLLDQAIKDMDTEKFLTEEFLVNLIFGLMFASFETISMVLTLAFNFLSQHPSVVEELIVEHEIVLKNRGENLNSPLTWDEYKSMTFTLQVINETLRLANITSPGFLRRALKDIEVNGYTIPAGWTIMVATSAQQLNPKIFKDPLLFNPWRWKDLDSNIVSKNFTPFGGGMRQCAGAEYSKVFIVTFLHVAITKYTWTKIKGGEISRIPFLDLGKGIHIKVLKKHN